jgi:hypothetical protein
MDLDELEALAAEIERRGRAEAARDDSEAARAADEAWRAQSVALPERERAAAALALLLVERPWTLDDLRPLGVPRVSPARARETVEEMLRRLDPALVVDVWLEALAAGVDSGRLDAAAAAAVGGLGALAPFRERLLALLAEATPGRRQRIEDALAHAPPALDEELVALLQACDATTAVRVAASLAARSRAAAALIAERARADRGRMGAERTVAAETLAEAVRRARAPALAETAQLELDPDLRIGLLDRDRWARALVASAGEAGLQQLLQRMGSPGWSSPAVAGAAELARLRDGDDGARRRLLAHANPMVRIEAAYAARERRQSAVELAAVWTAIDRAGGWHALCAHRHAARRALEATPTDADDPSSWQELARRVGAEPVSLPPLLPPLEAVTAPDANLRRHALASLMAQAQPDLLMALLAALALDRHLTQHVYRERWQAPALTAWLPLLTQLSLSDRPVDAALAAWPTTDGHGDDDLFIEQLRVLRGRHLAEALLDAGSFDVGVALPQRSTPALDELIAIGPAAFAARLPPPFELVAEARARLAAREAALMSD